MLIVGSLDAAWPQLWHDELGSTNTEAQRRAAEGEPGPLWIAAKSQLAGRGRRGNTWVSKTGNLYASAMFRLDMPLTEAAKLCFVAGLAVADMIHTLSQGRLRPELKWPNDVRVDRHKLCGILIESGRTAGDDLWVVCGIGVNLAQSPQIENYLTTSLAERIQMKIPPEEALEALDLCLRKRLDQFLHQGFDATRTDWLKYAEGLGQLMTTRTKEGERTGRFVDITSDGTLILETPENNRIHITAGDVQLVTGG